jgi:hypothetical protein
MQPMKIERKLEKIPFGQRKDDCNLQYTFFRGVYLKRKKENKIDLLLFEG